ncbi:hypothetical protein EZS27_028184 [termite gut metagenome]|uniref:Abortive phage infection protein C-terminal domain-containing protein n=1 Tax=termite gut metagenome TaxID=433724 RepID=A0A5J4QLJ0_9ZZZZ
MANINDFKLIAAKSRRYFDLCSTTLGIEETIVDSLFDIQKERFGFYYYILEAITDLTEILDLTNLITDSEFNSIFFQKKAEDYGIDAVYIDEDEKEINLFNFKYREKFNKDKKQSINEVIISTKFINSLVNEDTNHLDGKLGEIAKNIIDKLINSKEVWKLVLYIVNNENIELSREEPNLKQLEDLYGLEIVPIGLSQVSELMSIRPESVSAKLILDKDAIMSYTESSISSSKSYIIRLSISDLIRITSNSEDLRNEYNIEDSKSISNVELDMAVLFDNIRGLILKSKFNINISKTLKEEPSKFFMYNNGLTLIASDIEVSEVNIGKKVKLYIKDFQVLNGGQTLRTIHDFNKQGDENLSNYLSKGEILVRIFKATEDVLKNKIAQFTNSQNAISIIDLKSLNPEQFQLEQYLDDHGIVYSRKNGDTGLSDAKKYDCKISMEKFGQILFSIKGFPEKASNQKKLIFDKYYDSLFGENNLIIEKASQYIKTYFQIKRIYDKDFEQYEGSDQKYFYILYLIYDLLLNDNIHEVIIIFESLLKEYTPNNPIGEARILIQVKFREYVEENANRFKVLL